MEGAIERAHSIAKSHSLAISRFTFTISGTVCIVYVSYVSYMYRHELYIFPMLATSMYLSYVLSRKSLFALILQYMYKYM